MRAKRGSLPLFVLVLLLLVAVETQGQPASKPLLVETSRSGSIKVEPGPTLIRHRRVLVDLSQLRNKRLRLPLFGGVEVVLVRDEEPSGPSRAFVWEGEVEGQPGSLAVLANVKEVLVGDVMTRDRKGSFAFYQLRYLGNRVHVLKEVDQSKFPEEERTPDRPRTPRPISRRPRSTNVDFLLAAERSDHVAEGRLASATKDLSLAATLRAPVPDCEDPATRIDALVVYSDDALRAVTDKDEMVALIEAAVAATNRSYRKSEVTQRLHLVHSQEVQYRESGNGITDWERLANTSDGHLNAVLPLRNTHAADVVVLLVKDLDECGRSKVMPTVSPGNESSAYAVVALDCTAGPTWSFTHELGHIMGARHDREDDDAEGEPFPFNHGFVKRSPTASSPWRTIMAKGEGTTRIPWWSNPGVRYPDASGDPTGTRNTDNHRALEETASTVANFRCKSP